MWHLAGLIGRGTWVKGRGSKDERLHLVSLSSRRRCGKGGDRKSEMWHVASMSGRGRAGRVRGGILLACLARKGVERRVGGGIHSLGWIINEVCTHVHRVSAIPTSKAHAPRIASMLTVCFVYKG